MSATRTRRGVITPAVQQAPGTDELARVCRAITRLQTRVSVFLSRHGVRCRCPLCQYLRVTHPGWPDVFDQLAALRCALSNANATLETERPDSVRELARAARTPR